MIWKMGEIIRFFDIFTQSNKTKKTQTHNKTHLLWFVHIRIDIELVWLFVTDQLSPNRTIRFDRLKCCRLSISLMKLTIECECVNAFMLIDVSSDSEIEYTFKMHNFSTRFYSIFDIGKYSFTFVSKTYYYLFKKED